MLIFIIFSVLLTFVNADPRCPYPSCGRTYYSYSGQCSINCNTKTFPDAGPINVNKINSFTLNNLEMIPKNAFQNLSIYSLTINSGNLTQVDEGAFDNVESLERFNLNQIKNLSIFFEKNRIEALFNVTNHVSISNAELNNQSVVEILDNLKSWTHLSSLDISNNNFQHFSYDFNNFIRLNSLTLYGNFISSFDIKGDRISYLSLGRNKIQHLRKEMFVDLPNLSTLDLDNNLIEKIYNDSFESTKKLQSIRLGYNKINYIEPNSFCELSFNKYSSSLTLSGNNLSDTNLYCLENLWYLYVSSVKFSGEINQKRLGNPQNLNYLYLDNNKIDKLSFENMTSLQTLYLYSNNLENFTTETIKAFPNLLDLDIRNNKFDENNLENFNLLKKLKYLYLSNNLLTRIEPNHFSENTNLLSLHLDSNRIESVKFAKLDNLKTIYLNYNRLRVLEKESFSKLSNLQDLYLYSNSIAKIHPKTFESNSRLSILSLRNNQLTTTPDISQLKILNSLDLRNNKISALPNHAFERRLDEANPLKSNIQIDLTNNNIEKYTSKTFCSQHASSLGFLGFELLINDINKMDKCMLRQFNSDSVKITSNIKPSCQHLLMAEYKKIKLNGNVTQCQHLSTDFIEKECYSNQKYKCPKGDELVRHTSWITGDPHLYSYKNKYELCSTGKDAVCFEYGNFKLLCSDAQVGALNQRATVLVSLKFVYTLSNSKEITYEANKTSFPTNFGNGQTIIFNNEKSNHNYNDILAELINADDGSKVIYIPNANTHIFISKWNSYYSITLRATHETYSESVGYLYEGCRLQDQVFNSRIKRRKSIDNKQIMHDDVCQAECSNFEINTEEEEEEENMPEQVIREACLFDCREIGPDSIEMIKSMVEKIDTFVQSDIYPNMSFPSRIQETSYFSSDENPTSITFNVITTKHQNNLINTDVQTSSQTSNAPELSTKENLIITNTNEDIKSSTKDILTITSDFSKKTTSSIVSNSNTTAPNQSNGSLTLKEFIFIGISIVFFSILLVILVVVCKLKKKIRVSNQHETELDEF